MDVGLARLDTARRRVLASRAVPPLSKDASSHGFAMAALLTAMSIMAIALAAALPARQQMMQREKEEERRPTGAKPGVDDGYGAITRRRTALTRFRTAEASIRCHRENSGVGRGIHRRVHGPISAVTASMPSIAFTEASRRHSRTGAPPG